MWPQNENVGFLPSGNVGFAVRALACRQQSLKETDQARALAGKTITVVESKDGSLQLRVGSRSFPFTESNKDDARVTQGAIVSNKLLAGALQQIKEQQAVRDADKLRRLRAHRERQLQLKRTAG